LITTIYPKHDWLPWKLAACPPSYWNDIYNQKKFMAWATKQLNIERTSDWYRISSKVLNILICLTFQELCDIGGSGLLNDKYRGSLLLLLSTIYPQYQWTADNFLSMSTANSYTINTQKQFMDAIAKQLNIKEMSDWYKVTVKVIGDRKFAEF
jgi:hypothetical protein